MMQTKNRYLIMAYITDYTIDNGKAPLLREIAGKMGITIQSAAYHVQYLEDQGRLERHWHQHRGIVLLPAKVAS